MAVEDLRAQFAKPLTGATGADLAIRASKTAMDISHGLVNQATKLLLEVFNPQNKNIFEMILTPETIEGVDKKVSISQIAHVAVDPLITKVCLQSIDIPMMSFETERVGNAQMISDVIYPEEVTLTFIENELSTVRMWLANWLKQIVYVSNDPSYGMIEGLSSTPLSNTPGWTFYENQNFAKKKAIIIPLMTTGLPSLVWYELRGLRIKSIENITFDQKESDPMYITVICSVDNCWMKSPV